LIFLFEKWIQHGVTVIGSSGVSLLKLLFVFRMAYYAVMPRQNLKTNNLIQNTK